MGAAPHFFHCPKARQNQRWDGHTFGRDRHGRPVPAYRIPLRGHDVVRTGRTKPAPRMRSGATRRAADGLSHEFRCSCGHVGWSCHFQILEKPLEGD